MKKYLGIKVLILSAVFFMTAAISMAGLEKNENSLEGIVVAVSPTQIIIRQEEENGLKISEVTVEIGPETEYEKVDFVDELKEEDIVRIEYENKEEKKQATLIAKVELKKDVVEELTEVEIEPVPTEEL